jgi:hypothetical protein
MEIADHEMEIAIMMPKSCQSYAGIWIASTYRTERSGKERQSRKSRRLR